MIKKPEELTFEGKKFSMILYGAPGVGKTTLALSAPNPILIDFDRGISRVKAPHRKATIVCETYEEVLRDIESPEMKEFETIVIDTGGSFVTFLQDWAMRTNPAVNKQKNGGISIKGFGAVKQEFQRFTSLIRDTMNKNIIYVFHADETKDKDGNAQQRLLCEGAAKNIVWQPCDFGGFVQMIGETRVIGFTPTQEFFAKGCYGIEGQRPVPTLKITDKNDFLTRLFEEARANIASDDEQFREVRSQYDAIMVEATALIDSITNADEANAAAEFLPTLNHVLTSKREASSLLNAKAKDLGLVWNKEHKKYFAPMPAEGSAEAPAEEQNNG